MVISVLCKVKEIFERGKNYRWSKPETCPHCKKSHVWGHGFVGAYFDGFSGFVYLRRWRCPACWCVIRARPRGYFQRFQATLEEIRFRLSSRISGGPWVAGNTHRPQGNWFRGSGEECPPGAGKKVEKIFFWAFESPCIFYPDP